MEHNLWKQSHKNNYQYDELRLSSRAQALEDLQKIVNFRL
jgi:hypothetical protein